MKNLVLLFQFWATVILAALFRFSENLCGSASLPRRLCSAEWTRITDLWVPSIIEEGMQENVVERTAFLDSGVVATSPELTRIASGGGTEVTIPFLIEPNHADQLQTQDTAPELRRMTSGTQKAAVFNRVSTLGMHALAAAVSGVARDGDLLSALIRNI